MSKLLHKYNNEIKQKLRDTLQCSNDLAIPKFEKVVLSMGVGTAVQDKKRIEAAEKDLSLLAGQKAVVCRAKKSVSNFKLRKDYPIGCKVTLRGKRMYEFLERLIHVAIPRIRDFRGLSPKAFDGHGNYSLGLAEQTVFPEIDIDRMEYAQGLNVTIVTTARSDEEGRTLLTLIGMPFRN